MRHGEEDSKAFGSDGEGWEPAPADGPFDQPVPPAPAPWQETSLVFSPERAGGQDMPLRADTAQHAWLDAFRLTQSLNRDKVNPFATISSVALAEYTLHRCFPGPGRAGGRRVPAASLLGV